MLCLSLFTAILYGAFTATLSLLPFVLINGVHLSGLVAGLAFIPLQVLIAMVSPMAGILCRRFGHSVPLAAGAFITGLGCAAALRIGLTATYWDAVFPAVVLVALGMSLVLAPMTTLAITSVDTAHAATASGFNGALSRAGAMAAVALLGSVLQGGGQGLISHFHTAMGVCAAACVVACVVALFIPPET